ncbi:HlyD family efflux transporter periplasmic adaptor subunit [Corallococcus exercitus]|uniref:HlyD family secretion protein n=1 Tax=Corallococcus exercitus TaxID=2316736 RepID=UPI000EA09508|nr:HlyD family efflux transporter periplasmic adaptor subunit [Corallococcus exercitus]RKG82051.1 HlyD family efflux transporter periplasmic adaptor subunit [Corallococcus exercitus]
MASDFSNTLESLRADSLWRILGWMLTGVLVIGLWTVWFFSARVLVSESAPARVEVSQTAYPIEAPVSGRIARIHVSELNRAVSKGELLFELDAESQRLELEEAKARRDARIVQRALLDKEYRIELSLQQDVTENARLLLEEARLRQEQSGTLTAQAHSEAARVGTLLSQGFASEAERELAVARAQQQQAQSEVFRIAMARTARDSRLSEGARQVTLERLKRDLSLLDGEIDSDRWLIERLTHEIERRRIRAPVEGQLAERVPLQLDRYVHEGESLASILPPGNLRVVAAFSPSAAIARIHSGQRAFVRFDGFPWLHFGKLPVTVSHVASELREGRVRVELSIPAVPPGPLVLQHGMSGFVDVELTQASPAVLTLQALGQRLDAMGGSSLQAPEAH